MPKPCSHGLPQPASDRCRQNRDRRQEDGALPAGVLHQCGRDTPSADGGNTGNFNRYLTPLHLGWTRTLTTTVINDTRLSGFRGIQDRRLSLGTGDGLGIPNLSN